MKILAIITARKNSRWLFNKNRAEINKKPLFYRSVNSVKNVPHVCDILISTDDNKILQLAKKLNVLTPWLRPKHLASDKTSSINVLIHALNWYEKKIQKVDGVLLLQPTSPFRKKQTIFKAIRLFKKYKKRPVLSVSKYRHSPLLSFKIHNKLLQKFFRKKYHKTELYYLNGVLYLISPKDLKKRGTFLNNNSIPLIIDSSKEIVDIDDLSDLVIARKLTSLKI